MKIATRIALLQWQANPADPSGPWRRFLAWITPGMREAPTPGMREAPNGLLRRVIMNRMTVFVAGIVVGGALAIGLLMEKPIGKPKLTANESYLYDQCLVAKNGNTTACDAVLRLYRLNPRPIPPNAIVEFPK
jgi:hypothetical protein